MRDRVSIWRNEKDLEADGCTLGMYLKLLKNGITLNEMKIHLKWLR